MNPKSEPGPSNSSAEAGAGALDGIRVVDLTRILAGPLCAMWLGDMGAEVIKIEQPGRGDDTRGWGPPFAQGEAAYFLGVNRNKRSLTLDLSTDEGLDLLRRLIRRADVVLDNFKTGTLQRWGLTDEWFEAEAPAAVRMSVLGYGSSGPKAATPRLRLHPSSRDGPDGHHRPTRR